jgi:hypothetical protein
MEFGSRFTPWMDDQHFSVFCRLWTDEKEKSALELAVPELRASDRAEHKYVEMVPYDI